MDDLARETAKTDSPSGTADEAASVRSDLAQTLIRAVGKDPEHATEAEWFEALAHMLRGRMAKRWLETRRMMHRKDVKSVYYLSLEFLIGRSLMTHLINLGLEDEVCRALADFGVDLDAIAAQEVDAALGNGGLGRLAACFLDSLTTLGYPAFGYGIRYDHGMFAQAIEDGWQVEHPEDWLRHGNPWEFPRPAVRHTIGFGGRLVAEGAAARWCPEVEIEATAHDLQVSGFHQDLTNTIRLWSARALRAVDLEHFNRGEHVEAMRSRAETEALSRVLYPDDSTERGRELRLRQEYFFVSASLQDILGRYRETHEDFDLLPQKVAIQLNDTHPALAIPEMVRLLVDGQGLEWDRAWDLTRQIFAYTNHTLLPEALESWPVGLMERVLPRHLDIIRRIDDDFLGDVAARFPGDAELLDRVAIVERQEDGKVRMGHLAFVGSHRINGVSELHTRIMREKTFADFERIFPGRILCKTNGITMRRWLNLANPALERLVAERADACGADDGDVRLEALLHDIDDSGFRDRFASIKAANKRRLADYLKRELGVAADPFSLFDIQVKRIHEYKRQLLNLLQVIARYNRIKDGRTDGLVPRTVIFGGKAAASYRMAKHIIKLINEVAARVNADEDAAPWLKLAFVPDYKVSLAEMIIPAADLSEQISTAGAEASGTGNMKFALNGALTIGTRDGANIEIGDAVGEENMFFFGLTAGEVDAKRTGGYAPRSLYEADEELRRALDMILDGSISEDARDAGRPVVDSLLDRDHYVVLADFRAYMDAQHAVDTAFTDSGAWTRKAIVNAARMGRFSSDRTIREYASEIWNVAPFCLLPDSGAT